jgi:hypothetical protein
MSELQHRNKTFLPVIIKKRRVTKIVVSRIVFQSMDTKWKHTQRAGNTQLTEGHEANETQVDNNSELNYHGRPKSLTRSGEFNLMNAIKEREEDKTDRLWLYLFCVILSHTGKDYRLSDFYNIVYYE